MLGERLFQKVRSRTISLTKLMSYLRVNTGGGASASGKRKQDFAKFYWQVVREIETEEQ
jgi:hypothetical protein